MAVKAAAASQAGAWAGRDGCNARVQEREVTSMWLWPVADWGYQTQEGCKSCKAGGILVSAGWYPR